jgi:hypothetical protein
MRRIAPYHVVYRGYVLDEDHAWNTCVAAHDGYFYDLPWRRPPVNLLVLDLVIDQQ